MFKVVSTHLFWWPVTVKMPDPDNAGRLSAQTFELRFEALPLDRARAIDAARAKLPAEEQDAHAFDFLLEISKDWREVVDADGSPIPFTADGFQAQLSLPWFRDGVVAAYVQATSGQEARLGN